MINEEIKNRYFDYSGITGTNKFPGVVARHKGRASLVTIRDTLINIWTWENNEKIL